MSAQVHAHVFRNACALSGVLNIPRFATPHRPGSISPLVLEADDNFFRGALDDLAPFELPSATLHSEPGHFAWFELDESGQRLIAFAHRFGAYDWRDDPHHAEQSALLRALSVGNPDDPVEGDYETLRHCLFAVVRADRFTEGLVATHLLALTRIANELRRRLLQQRTSK